MQKRKQIVLSILFIVIALLLAEDMISDLMEGASLFHMIEEILIMILIFFGIVFIWKDNFSLSQKLDRTEHELEAVKKDSLHWKEENENYLQGLGKAIDQQMEKWQLTLSEKEIARMLMKGLSMKEIADSRSTSERTVRQQALAVYAKSGLSGRASLSAFFLEHLLG